MIKIIVGIGALLFIIGTCSDMFTWKRRTEQPQVTMAERSKSSSSSASTNYEHDLSERCKDWIYNRNRAYKLGREGDQKGSEQARIAMLTFDRDLRKYFTEKQISDEIARLEASGYKVGF